MTVFVSVDGGAPPANLREALFSGIAPDGGLYMPQQLVPIPMRDLQRLRDCSLIDTASLVAQHLFSHDLSDDTIREIVERSLDFDIPVVPLEERISVVELFHGPTAAFKDIGARFMARLMAKYLEESERMLTILVATSGDTGSAIAQAFFRLEGIRVVVLFPKGQVSSLQRKLFTTLGENVAALSINGTFDDCQALVKRAFQDVRLRKELPLASGNSINIGRLLPQMFYYFHAVASLPFEPGQLVISTPSGNFGNLTGGLMAKRIGLHCDRFVAATNVNDVVPRFLETGRFEPRHATRTIANAMDVGNPSNFSRILHLYDSDLEAMRHDIVGSSHGDEEAMAAIATVHQQSGYLMDPHTAMGYLGLEASLADLPSATGFLLATAHPAKFSEVVEQAIGRSFAIPEKLAGCLAREEKVLHLGSEYDGLREYLVGARC